MPATQALAAFLAMAAVDFEFAHDGPAGNLGLELLIETILDHIAVAIGTPLGQRSVQRFIDAFRRRRFAMRVVAVLRALLAARLFGFSLRFALGERRGLALGGAFEFIDPLLLFANNLLQARILFAELLDFEKQLLN